MRTRETYSRTFKNGRPTMKRYSRVLPPHFSMSSPAAEAEPPVAMRSLQNSIQHSSAVHSLGSAHSLDNDAVLSGLDGIGLHLKLVHSVFLLVRNDVDISGQLSPLSDGHESRAEPKSENGSEKETTSVQANNDIDLA
jgi:hypothetical protein